MTAIVVPQTLPANIGRGDSNGDRARFSPVLELQRATQHLIFSRRQRISGWLGRLIIPGGAVARWRQYLWREQYTGLVSCSVVYSTSTPEVTAELRFDTPEASDTVELPPSVGPSAEEALTQRLSVAAGTLTAGDASGTPAEFDVRLFNVTTTDPEDTKPQIAVWSVRLITAPLTAVELTP